jgi:3-deoxy-D-manno-octulosonic-acid transferase
VHAASVGEFLSVLSLLERIRARGISVMLTSGTVTAARIAAQRLPDGVLHQFVPLDVPYFVETFFDHWRPNLALIAESEFWPNLITEGRRRGIPFVLVNGRLSDRSYGRWRMARGTAKALLSRIDLCLAQEADIAERFEQLGAKQVVTTGNLKFDTPRRPPSPRSFPRWSDPCATGRSCLPRARIPAKKRSLSTRTCVFAALCQACLP